jgi:C-terminal processing protease CtpA/Prc
MVAGIFLLMSFSANMVFAVEETGGIGMKISQLYNYTTNEDDKRGSLVVLDVFKGSPAQRYGVQRGDIILQVNDVVTKNHDFLDLLHNHLRGPSFTEVKIVIWRPSLQEKFEIVLQRLPMVY